MNNRYPNFQKIWINPTITCLHMLDQFGMTVRFRKYKGSRIQNTCRLNAMGDLLRDTRRCVSVVTIGT